MLAVWGGMVASRIPDWASRMIVSAVPVSERVSNISHSARDEILRRDESRFEILRDLHAPRASTIGRTDYLNRLKYADEIWPLINFTNSV